MKNIEQKTINTIRALSADIVQKAKSGHPGLPLGAAPMAYAIWAKNMKHSPKNPNFFDRDRFILSAGHGSSLIYSLLHLFGYGLSMDDLKEFRQENSKTPGHPEFGHTIGVEITTGPLGQGIANGVGFAMAEAHLAAKFNKPGLPLVDHYTYVLCGDGCLMEGISGEASSLAGTLGLSKLIVLYDSNSITIEGDTDIAFREDVAKRYEAYGWNVIEVSDGNDLDAISAAIEKAKAQKEKPTFIKVTTIIGYGCPKQGCHSCHGEPLGDDNVLAMKQNFGLSTETFAVDNDVYADLNNIIDELNKNEDNWNALCDKYKAEYPAEYAVFTAALAGKMDMDKLNSDAFWAVEDKPDATRNLSGLALNRLAEFVPNLFGGSADLAPSNKSNMKGAGDFSKEDYTGKNLHFGVREHAMGAICNAICAHGGLITYGATFFVFSDYVKPAMRLSALMNLPVTYIFTHDSIGVGEDGPTHQPIEQLAAMRSIPNFVDFRPADGTETIAAWYYAMTNGKHPVGIALTRQNLPQYPESSKDALKGGYVLKDSPNPEVILIGTGSEVELCYKAYDELKAEGISARVVSMPSVKLFEMQEQSYIDSVIPKAIRARVVVEAGSSFGWHKWAGLDGKVISIDHFGASAPFSKLFPKFGFTVENVVNAAKETLKK